MASPEEVVPVLPETLPDDFVEWDGDSSSTLQAQSSTEWRAREGSHSFSDGPKTRGLSAERDAILESLVDGPPIPASNSSASALVNHPDDFIDWASEAPPTPTPASRNEWEEWEAPQPFGKSQKPGGQSGDRNGAASPVPDKPHASGSAGPAPAVVKPQSDPSIQIGNPSPAPLPDSSNEWEELEAPRSLDKSPKPLAQSAQRNGTSSPAVDKPRVSGSASPTPVIVKPKYSADSNGEPHTTATPGNRTEWAAWEADHSVGKSSKPVGQSADREAVLTPAIDKPRTSLLTPTAPVAIKPKKLASEPMSALASRASLAAVAAQTPTDVPVLPSRPNVATVGAPRKAPQSIATAKSESSEGMFHSFRSLDTGVEGEQKAAKKKWMIIAAVSVCAMLLLLMIISMVLQHGTKPASKEQVQPTPAVTDNQQDQNAPAPAASEPVPQSKPPAATESKSTTTNSQPTKGESGNSPQVQSQMMNDQLSAPVQIPQAVKKQTAENGPPPAGFGAALPEGMGGNDASESVFNGQAKPIVKAPKPVTISAGVATGLLIQKNPPTYPAIARSARVSGSVTLEATISKSGSIKDLHVVSGPEMLRQSALDAVRTWRYKPYQLNNEPVEVQATINVIFTLGP